MESKRDFQVDLGGSGWSLGWVRVYVPSRPRGVWMESRMGEGVCSK